MSRVQSANTAEPCTCVVTSVTKKGFKFFEIAAVVSEGGAAHTIDLCKKRHNERRLKQGEEEVAASKWRALVKQKGSYGQHLVWNNSGEICWNVFHHQKKRGPD